MWIFDRYFVCVTLTRCVLGLLPLVSSHGRQKRIFKGVPVSPCKRISVVAFFLMGGSIQKLVRQYLDSWNLHWLVDHQLDLPPLL